ncbi:hypothetical protein A8F94_03210 [Bacillus sp. FJAT-27225]|nr:hypothetical protein A8F94_03210 [Bacillus sp. FJAT-27225]
MPYGFFPQQDMWNPNQLMAGYQTGYPPAGGAWPQPPLGHQGPQNKPESHFLFQNPLETGGYTNGMYGQSQQFQPMNMAPQFNPYPKGQFMQKPPGAMQSILGSFKSQDGTYDINKMVNTAGQMVNTVSQASALIKGLGGVLKV